MPVSLGGGGGGGGGSRGSGTVFLPAGAGVVSAHC